MRITISLADEDKFLAFRGIEEYISSPTQIEHYGCIMTSNGNSSVPGFFIFWNHMFGLKHLVG